MSNYIFVLIPEDPGVLNVLMETSDSFWDHLNDIASDLAKRNYSGTVRFDQLLHSGSRNRFVRCAFDGASFDRSSFEPETLPADSRICRVLEWFLVSNPDILKYSVLPTWEQEALLAGKPLSAEPEKD